MSFLGFNINENYRSRGSRYLRRGKSGPTAAAVDLTITPSFAGIAAPAAPTAAASASGGSLVAGTYTYSVTAYNVNGETLPSTTVAATTTGTTGSVALTLAAVVGASGYRIYGRAAGAQYLLADNGNLLTFNDTGALTPNALVAPPTVNKSQVIAGAGPGQVRAGDSLFRTPSGGVAAIYNPAAQSATYIGECEDDYPQRLGFDNVTSIGQPQFDPHPVVVAIKTSGEFLKKTTVGDVYAIGALVYVGLDPQTVTVVANGTAIGRVCNDQNPAAGGSVAAGPGGFGYSLPITGSATQEVVIEVASVVSP